MVGLVGTGGGHLGLAGGGDFCLAGSGDFGLVGRHFTPAGGGDFSLAGGEHFSPAGGGGDCCLAGLDRTSSSLQHMNTVLWFTPDAYKCSLQSTNCG